MLLIPGILASSLVQAKSYRDTILDDSPRGFWMFDETSGSTAEDSTSFNNDLTFQNSPTLNVSTGLTGITKAITLNGSNQRAISTLNLAHFNINPSGNWSMEIWLKFSTSNFGSAYIIRNDDASSLTQLAGIFVNNGLAGRIQVQALNSTTAAAVTLNSDGGWNDNTWHQVVVTAASGGAMRLYVDKVEKASSTTARYSNTSNKTIYVGSNVSSQYYNGSLTVPAIYNTTLSLSQIETHYDKGI